MSKNLNEIVSDIKEINSNLESNINKLLDEKNKIKKYNKLLEEHILEIHKENIELKSNIWVEIDIIKNKKFDFISKIIFVCIFAFFFLSPFIIYFTKDKFDFSEITKEEQFIFWSLMSPVLVWIIIFALTKLDNYENIKDIKNMLSWGCIFSATFIIFIAIFLLIFLNNKSSLYYYIFILLFLTLLYYINKKYNN